MSPSHLWPMVAALHLASCARNLPPANMTPKTPDTTAPMTSELTSSTLDEAAREILQTGKYETATFALG